MNQHQSNYNNRIHIPLAGNSDYKFFTSSRTLLSIGFERVVIGGRGPYVEFNDRQIILEALEHIDGEHYYYDEWRTKDASRLKLYHQIYPVNYADYVPGMWYATPFELFDIQGGVLIEPLSHKRDDGFSIFG